MNATNESIPRTSGLAWHTITGATLCVLLYLAATFYTGAYFMGDTVDYTQSIVLHLAGRDYLFWEFGHLLWRPLGYVLFRIAGPLTNRFVGSDALATATVVLLSLSWLGGLLSVLSLYGVLNRVCRRRWPVAFAILALISAQSFLNYFHTGAPYIPGLSLILLGMYLLLAQGKREKPSLLKTVLAGASLAGAGLLWLPFVLTIPAALLMPLVLLGFNRQRMKLSLLAAVTGAIIGGAAYFAVTAHIGIHNVSEFRAWTEKTSRTVGSTNKGVTKTVFGFARSFVNMGNDGMLFKRYLLHDPFNPVSIWDLLRLSLWKLLAFYLFLFLILFGLATSINGRRLLILFLVNVLPVIAFAIYWQGGDPERYLPLYPLLFIAVAWALDTEQVRNFWKYPLVLFVFAMVVSNGVMMARARLNRQQDASAARLSGLVPLLKPGSWIFTANWQDDLVNFNRSFPLNSLNRKGTLIIGALISPGEPEVAHWQQEFATRAGAVWSNGGDVWISRRLLSPRPRPEWNWVEGDDPRVSWKDLYSYAARLELGQAVGGDDGFVLLAPSEQNRRLMSGTVAASTR